MMIADHGYVSANRLPVALLRADLHDQLDPRTASAMIRRPQTETHPALVRTLIACAAMTDLAHPA